MIVAALVSLAFLALMMQKLVDVYFGGHYVCPSCGARNERRHSHDCPWNRLS